MNLTIGQIYRSNCNEGPEWRIVELNDNSAVLELTYSPYNSTLGKRHTTSIVDARKYLYPANPDRYSVLTGGRSIFGGTLAECLACFEHSGECIIDPNGVRVE